MVQIVDKEHKFNEKNNTMQNLLQFLFLYDKITFKTKIKNENSPKIISMIPILV